MPPAVSQIEACKTAVPAVRTLMLSDLSLSLYIYIYTQIHTYGNLSLYISLSLSIYIYIYIYMVERYRSYDNMISLA